MFLIEEKAEKVIISSGWSISAAAELTTYNRVVVGSNPTWTTIFGGIPKWLKGSVLKTDSGASLQLGFESPFLRHSK